MKKILVTFCLISLLGTAIIIPISVVAVNGILDFAVSEDGIAERMEIAESHAVDLSTGEKFNVTYNMSRSIKGGFADIYKDQNGNDYIYKDGKLTGFYSNEIKQPNTECTPVGEMTAKEIAIRFLSEFTDHVDEYVVRDFEEKANYGQYYITLSKRLGDIFTEEYAVASIMYDGAVKSIAVYNDGKYNNVSESIVEGVTEDVLQSYAQSEMEIIYSDKGNEFEMKDYYLKHDESGYYISIYGSMNDTLEYVRYELEN